MGLDCSDGGGEINFKQELGTDFDTHVSNEDMPIFKKMKFIDKYSQYGYLSTKNIYFTKASSARKIKYNEVLHRNIVIPTTGENNQGYYRIYYWYDTDAYKFLTLNLGDGGGRLGTLEVVGDFKPVENNLLNVQYSSINGKAFFANAKEELYEFESIQPDMAIERNYIDIEHFIDIKEVIPTGDQARAIYEKGNYIIDGSAGVGKSTTAVQKIKILTHQQKIREEDIVILVKDIQTLEIFRNLLKSINVNNVNILNYYDFERKIAVGSNLPNYKILIQSQKRANEIYSFFMEFLQRYFPSSILVDSKEYIRKEKSLFELIQHDEKVLNVLYEVKNLWAYLKDEKYKLEKAKKDIVSQYDKLMEDKRYFLLNKQKNEKLRNYLLDNFALFREDKILDIIIDKLDFKIIQEYVFKSLEDTINKSKKRYIQNAISKIENDDTLNFANKSMLENFTIQCSQNQKKDIGKIEQKYNIKQIRENLENSLNNAKQILFSLQCLEKIPDINKMVLRYLNKLENNNKLTEYHTIIIDEAQDFTKESIELIRLYAKNLVLTGDELQSLNSFGLKKWTNLMSINSYKEDGRLKVFSLKYNFRQTYELASFTYNYRQLELGRAISDIQGEYYENQKNFNKPYMRRILNGEDFIKLVSEKVLYISSNFIQKFPLVIFYENSNICEYYKALFKTATITYGLDDMHQNQSVDVLLISCHEISGREFPVVIAPLLDNFNSNLVYLMITRARYDLTLILHDEVKKHKHIERLISENILGSK
ncbi:MAG: hypothetical protein CR967_03175 [Proteobacteria bacterium]|nr:MAG: hypothetical protein CR967_03175 [Pseudomonadota bacterium]